MIPMAVAQDKEEPSGLPRSVDTATGADIVDCCIYGPDQVALTTDTCDFMS